MMRTFVALRRADGNVRFFEVNECEVDTFKRNARLDNMPVIAVIRTKLDRRPRRLYDTMRSG